MTRELRERALEESDIFLNSDDWDSAQVGSDAEKELLAIKLAAFAQAEIASLETRVKELETDFGRAIELKRIAEEKEASARQAEREQCAKDVCIACGEEANQYKPAEIRRGKWMHFGLAGQLYTRCDAGRIHERAQAEGKVAK